MTVQTSTPDLREIALADLYLHRMNPRQEQAEDDIEAKASSMAIVGQMENLLGYADPDQPGRIGIVAGGLRLAGAQKLAAEGWNRHPDMTRTDPLRVLVTDDHMLAQAWAAGENINRAAINPAAEVRAYRAMRDQGSTPDMIARTFGKPGRHVEGRLKLADLPDAVLDALGSRKISLDVAKALTLTDDRARQVEVLEAVIARPNLDARHVRRDLNPDAVVSTDRRALFVGLSEYTARGGALTEDLFRDEQLLHDEKLLDALFKERLEAAAEQVRADEGWHQAVPVGDPWVGYEKTDKLRRLYRTPAELPEADMDELEELEELGETGLNDEGRARLHDLRERARGDFADEDRARGTVFVYVNREGTLCVERAFAPASAKHGTGDDDGVTRSGGGEKPVMPQNCRDDLARIRLAAYQQAMADRTEMLLDLLAYQLETAAPGYANPLGITLAAPAVIPGVTDGTRIPARLAGVTGDTQFETRPDAAGFAAFREKGKKHRNGLLATHMARALDLHSDFSRALEAEAAPDIRAIWTPTRANFFGRIRADYLDRIWSDMLGLEDNDERRETFAKLKKAGKAEALEALFSDAGVQESHGLSRDQIAAIDAWLPEEMGDGA